MVIADWILTLAAGYLVCGLVFTVAFVTLGVNRLDPTARGTSASFRVLIVPGAAALWPLLAAKWLSLARRERNRGAS